MLSKSDAEGVRAHNRRIVIEHLRMNPQTTRRAAAEATGLSASSAASISGALIRDGLVREVVGGESDKIGRRGRPERRIELVSERASVAAVKLSVGELSVRLADYSGRVLAMEKREVPLKAYDADKIARTVAELVGTAIATATSPAACRLSRIVFAAQGKVDRDRRTIAWSPCLDRRDLEIASALRALTGTATSVHNDCSLMPEGFRWRDGNLQRDVATVFIGFGVGMGLAVGRNSLLGERNSSTEFGHIVHIPGGAKCRCGNRGCLEAYASDYAILRTVEGSSGDDVVAKRIDEAVMQQIAADARNGDGRAFEAFRQAGLAIGYGLGRVFTLIDPLPIVFTGSGAHAIDLLEPFIRRGILESAVAGGGADVPFSVVEDADSLIFDAATNRALSELDELYANGATDRMEAAE